MSYTVRILPFEKTYECEEGETLLAAGLRAGFNLRYGCRHGGCGSCKAKVVDGEVDMDEASSFALMDYEKEAGYALLCVTTAESDVTVEVDLTEEELLEAPSQDVQDIRTTIEKIDTVARDIVAFRLRLANGERLSFRPGQYVDLRVPGTDQWRSYSMASTPNDERGLDFLLKVSPGGLWSTYLTSKARIGDAIEARGPFGSFYLREDSSQMVFVAGGSGLAPVWAMLQQMRTECDTRPAWLYFGARSAEDLVYVEKLKRLEQEVANFHFVPALSEPERSPGWLGEVGLVTEVLDRKQTSWMGTEGYLCGPPGMVDAAIEVLVRHGVPGDHIFFDKFV